MKKDKDNSVILPNPKIDYMFDEKDNYWKIKTPQGKVVGFSFVGLQEKLVERLKEFVYSSLHDTTKSKILTIYSDYLAIKDFLIFYNKDIEDINYFSSFHISEYINTLETNESDKNVKGIIISINKFFMYFDYKVSEFLINETKRLYEKYINMKSKSSSFHLLPTDYYDSFISQMIKDRDNPSLSFEERAYACLGIIQSQIGLRTSELMNLEHNAIVGKINPEIGNKFKYLIYKTANKEQEAFVCTSYLNKLALKSWAILRKICLTKFNSESIYLFDVPNKEYRSLQDYFRKFSLKHNKILSSINNSWYNSYMHTARVCDICKDSKLPEGVKPDDIICYPIIHQFRVYRIHTYISMGVPINEVAKTVGHKDNQMTLSYTRSTEQGYQELRKLKYGCYSKEMLGILSDIAKQEGKTLEEYVTTPVPNGTCKKAICERRQNIIINFK